MRPELPNQLTPELTPDLRGKADKGATDRVLDRVAIQEAAIGFGSLRSSEFGVVAAARQSNSI
jgi:hypothetical protein